MATLLWTVAERAWCQQAKQEAQLLEERVYPSDLLHTAIEIYQVRARKCSLAVECNLAGCTCRWAFNNPNYDPFG